MPRAPNTNSRPHPPSAKRSPEDLLNNPAFTSRATRSGAQFSPYELTLPNFDLESLYTRRLRENDAQKGAPEADVVVLPGRALPDDDAPADGGPTLTIPGRTLVSSASPCSASTPVPPLSSPIPSTPTSFAAKTAPAAVAFINPTAASADPKLLSAKENSRRKMNEKRQAKRARSQQESGRPYVKGVALKHARAAQKAEVRVSVDAAELDHSIPAWIGARNPENGRPALGSAPALPASLLEGVEYTQEEVDQLAKAYGLRYLRWNGRTTIPIVDLRRRLLVLLGGQPGGPGWSHTIEGATVAMEERASRLRLSHDKLHHRRAQTSFAAVARGVSHGGGQTEPGELVVTGENRRVTDELLSQKAFRDIVGFTTALFSLWMPLLYGAYASARQKYKERMPQLRWPFEHISVFAACTWNFISTVCAAHVDFANLVWGWCVVTALGRFNPDLGGHLILWDLGLIIRFPPGASIFLPSALLTHSNTPIQPGETRSSFVQYCAGGLFRWIDQNFMTQADFERTATAEEKADAKQRAETRWEDGMAHFSNLDALFK